MKIAYVGCSHSTRVYGKSWALHMIEDLNIEKNFEVTVSGASNEMFIEKIKKLLDQKNEIDLFIVQLTEPSRMMFGLSGNDVREEYRKYFNLLEFNPDSISCHRTTNEISYYNFLFHSQDDDLNKLLNTDYKHSNIIRNHFLISDYNMKIKIFHTLMTMKCLFDLYNTKVIFFSWFVDLYKLADDMGYSNLLKNLEILDGCVIDFIKEKKLQPIRPNDMHYGGEEHKIIYDEYLKDFIKKHIQ